MKIRPWRYLVEFHHHNNMDCPQSPPKLGRGLIKVWGTGDLPLCAACAKLDHSLHPQLNQLGQAMRREAEETGADLPTFADVDDEHDPD